MLTVSDFFDLSDAAFTTAFEGATHCWDALKMLEETILTLFSWDYQPGIDAKASVHPTAVVNTDKVYVGAGAKIMPHAYIEGPAIIAPGATVGQGAYIRNNVILSPGAIAGHATEVKHAILLEDAHAPHFAYVGDSILGRGVNLGAGTKLSNLAMNSDKDPTTGKRPTVVIHVDDVAYDTELAKLGAIIGDYAQTGCNTVTNPGTLIGKNSLVYALASTRKGYIPANSILKVRQTQQVIEKRR